MNKIVLLGKLIKDPELKTIDNGDKLVNNIPNTISNLVNLLHFFLIFFIFTFLFYKLFLFFCVPWNNTSNNDRLYLYPQLSFKLIIAQYLDNSSYFTQILHTPKKGNYFPFLTISFLTNSINSDTDSVTNSLVPYLR